VNTIVITARTDGDNFDTFLGASLQKVQTKCVNISDTDDDIKPISSKYNVGLNIIKDNGLINDDTIIIFAKSDVYIIDDLFVDKLDLLFSTKPNLGLVGVVGVKTINENFNLLNDDNHPVNGIIYTDNDDPSKGVHTQFSDKGLYDDIIALTDEFLAVRGSIILNNEFSFTERLNTAFGVDISLSILKLGYNIASADILVVSDSDSDLEFDEFSSLLNEYKYPVSSKDIISDISSVVNIEL